MGGWGVGCGGCHCVGGGGSRGERGIPIVLISVIFYM